MVTSGIIPKSHLSPKFAVSSSQKFQITFENLKKTEISTLSLTSMDKNVKRPSISIERLDLLYQKMLLISKGFDIKNFFDIKKKLIVVNWDDVISINS